MNVLVTGAGSGIGRALALECARRGDRLFVCGRDAGRLGDAAEALRLAGAEVSWKILDVTDADATRAWVAECDATAPLDLVIANAGVSTGEETEENVRRTVATNVGGCINTVLPAIEAFRRRKGRDGRVSGQPAIAMLSSIAGYGPLSVCPSYSATKSFVKTWGLSLRGMLAPEGIRVSVVCPGFVRSRITDANRCPMPFFMEASDAASLILRRVSRNAALIAFPWPMRFAAWLLSCLPYSLASSAGRLLPPKNGRPRR